MTTPAGDKHQILTHGLNACMAEVRGPAVVKQRAIDAVRADIERKFSNQDLEFVISCVEHFIEWYLHSGPHYVDPRGREAGFGVIEYRLPADARVAIMGDWGTGMPDAAAMLTALLQQAKPAAILHLGDVYYSGTVDETKGNFIDVLDRCCAEAGLPARLPVFTIPGNHDYYSGGVGFFWGLEQLNQGTQRQQASYFCLRTADDRWQFLGLDTGRNDHVPGLAFEPFYRAPRLEASEIDWARDKLTNFAGHTILLTHHQVFSARSQLNGKLSFREAWINRPLLEAVRPFLTRIPIWLWGHEHSLALFEDSLFGVPKGRLLGCSAFELPVGDGYTPLFDHVRYQAPEVRLGVHASWLNHACGLIDLGEERIDYYEFPSWGGGIPPAEAKLNLLASEAILGGRL